MAGIRKAPGMNLSTKTKRQKGMSKAAFQRVNSDACEVVESESHPTQKLCASACLQALSQIHRDKGQNGCSPGMQEETREWVGSCLTGSEFLYRWMRAVCRPMVLAAAR